MKIPTITKFNSWPANRQAEFIASESQGSKPEVNQPGLLIYPERDIAIVYWLYPSGQFKEAVAGTLLGGLVIFKNQCQTSKLNLN
jgi:hypothetical protein